MPAESLTCRLWRRTIFVAEFQVWADPDDIAYLQQKLREAVDREGYGAHYLPEFTLEVHMQGTRETLKVTA